MGLSGRPGRDQAKYVEDGLAEPRQVPGLNAQR